MPGIIPIPTSRVGDLFVRQRLSSQVMRDQLDLFKLQNQISTGVRLQLPSDDAPAALRAINLQRLIDRKDQIKTNIQASAQYLGSADSRLGSIGTSLIELRASVVGIAGNVVPDSARQAALQDVTSLIQELVNTANSKLGERYLFSGAKSLTQPYDYNGEFVEYSGNDGALRSYVDFERLFDTNVSGLDVFGGISAAVEGTVDVNPQLTSDTLVSTLNGGEGIGRNPAITLSVNDGLTTKSAVIELSRAVTIGDVAKFIENSAPAGTNISVEVTATGLVIRGNGDTISVAEAAGGRTAHMLGVLTDPNAPSPATITGLDLNPALLRTTSLGDLLGKRAQGVLNLPGANNDLHLTANANGAAFNATVVFQNGATIGNETAVYNSGTNTLTVTIQDGVSTASHVAAAITAEGTFTATTDYHDALNVLQIGTGEVDLSGSTITLANATTGGAGEMLDTVSGLVLTNMNQSVTLDISSAETVEDVLNLINNAGLGLVADINAAGTGIDVRSKISGAEFSIGENGGNTASQLGIRTFRADLELAELNFGQGVPTTATLETLDASKLDVLNIVARDGTSLMVNLAGATTMQDVVNLINNHVDNTGTTSVLARMTGGGNGLELVDSSTPDSGSLRVDVPLGSEAAEYLGFVPAGATTSASPTSGPGGTEVLGGKMLLGNDFVIVARDGTQLSIDLAGATTVQDVLDRINNNADNVPPVITAQIARVGNGIELIDSSVGAGTLTVQASQGSLAAQYLGFIAKGQSESNPAGVTTEGANQVLKSADTHTHEAESMFTTLVRLRTALENNDVEELGRTLARLDTDISRLNFSRSDIGGRLQNLDVIDVRLQDENVELRSALSQDLDVDLIDAISQLTSRQYAFEASLRTSASLMQLSLLNFL
jgi:flagellar hook-associated protein 3